ncbi:MAG TPA: DUF5682 family protein, partial [Polyangium sp.]|nr:DUF5682 family protein [Polyangium sp.]
LQGDLSALRVLAEVLRHGAALEIEIDDVYSALHRRISDRETPAMLRGAALGTLWYLDAESVVIEAAIDHALQASSEGRIGDFLAGLFALARGPALRDDKLIGAIDAVIAALGDDVFLIQLPALRLAFSWFPPAERARIGTLLAARWGKRPDSSWIGEVPADQLAAGLALDSRVFAWGLELGVLE